MWESDTEDAQAWCMLSKRKAARNATLHAETGEEITAERGTRVRCTKNRLKLITDRGEDHSGDAVPF